MAFEVEDGSGMDVRAGDVPRSKTLLPLKRSRDLEVSWEKVAGYLSNLDYEIRIKKRKLKAIQLLVLSTDRQGRPIRSFWPRETAALRFMWDNSQGLALIVNLSPTIIDDF